VSALLFGALLLAPQAVGQAVGKTGALYDAEAKLLTARGAAAADLRAPSAAVARVKAERVARIQAEKKLVAALLELGDRRDQEALAKAAALATVQDERFGSDGSVELTLQLSAKDAELKPRKHPL
jgi:hypothetical protein